MNITNIIIAAKQLDESIVNIRGARDCFSAYRAGETQQDLHDLFQGLLEYALKTRKKFKETDVFTRRLDQ